MRVINFNAGPAGLPTAVLEQARDEFLDFQSSGMSIMEHSHRGQVYERVHQAALSRLRLLLNVPESHAIAFYGGSASLQFAMIPLNFLKPGTVANYTLTGVWAEKALDEGKLVGTCHVAATTRRDDGRYVRVPRQDELKLSANAAYLHTTSNNTIAGTQYQSMLDAGDVPHICDMSSDFLSRRIDVSKFDLIYAGAQKNIGPSGVVVAIIKKSFLQTARTDVPKILRYATQVENDSLYNTPPTFAIYMVHKVLEWLEGQGGVAAIEQRNAEKAKKLYGALERLRDFYQAPVEVGSRSSMNIVFNLPSDALNSKFVAEAEKNRMFGLKGHRLSGGIRVSAYNAVSMADIDALVSFMEVFAQQNRSSVA